MCMQKRERQRHFCTHFLDGRGPIERVTLYSMPIAAAAEGEEADPGPVTSPPTRAAGRAFLHGEVLPKLRDYIVEGNLPGGARIPERQLCELFGISRTPLREALKVLAAEGLVDLLPNRGARVRVLSERDICELFDLMAGLEALAGRLACERVTDGEISEIEILHHEMYTCFLRRDLHGYFKANQAIHQKIVRAAKNDALSLSYSGYAGRIQRIRYSANLAKTRDRWGEAMREHEAMLDALRRRAGQELSDILFLHLRHKLAAAMEHLGASGGESPDATEPAFPPDLELLED
jgi:DNA-binding GntR family transcriptional regulator